MPADTRSVASLVLPPRLDATNAEAVSGGLLAQLRGCAAGQSVRLDASALQSFDSSALATVMALQRQAAGQGSSLELHAAPVRLVELARLYGVQDLVQA